MKNYAAVGAAFILLLLSTSCNIVDNRYVATVNGESIKLSEFNFYLEASKSIIAQQAGRQGDANFWQTAQIEGKSAGEAAKEKALDEAVNSVIASQKAKEAGIIVDDAARQQIASQKSSLIQNFGGQAQYESELKKYNFTDADINKIIERDVLGQKLKEKLASSDPAFKADDAALKDFYVKNYVRAYNILFKTIDDQNNPLPADQQQAAKEKADKVLAELKGGADFVTVMNQYSEDPGSKSQPDGYTFTKNEMVKEFENAAFALKEGEISGVVQTQFGYHIIKRLPLEPFDTFIGKDAQNKTKLQAAVTSDAFNNKVQEWKKSSKIEINDNQLKSIQVK